MDVDQNRSRGRGIRGAGHAATAALMLVSVVAACGGGDDDADAADASSPLAGWRRTDVVGRMDVQPYDEVATASAPGRLAWLGRPGWDTDALVYAESVDGGSPDTVELARPASPGGPTSTPATVATAADGGWVAVADIRAAPGDLLVGLEVWRGAGVESAASIVGDALVPAAGTTIAFDRVSAGRVGETAVVVALTGPTPPEDDGPTGGPAPQDVVAWTATGDGGWEPSPPDLGVDGPLGSLRVTGDGERLVLAGVTAGGDALLWSSQDGRSWEPLDDAALPSGIEGVDLLATVAPGEVAVGWHRDVDGDSRTVVQRLGDDAVADVGTVEPAVGSGIDGAVALGATVDTEDELVLVGTGYNSSHSTSSGATPVPLVWTRDDDSWIATRQTELVGHLDNRFRAVTTTSDGDLAGLITPFLGIDVELWQWEAPRD
jgi:hypothetical protein